MSMKNYLSYYQMFVICFLLSSASKILPFTVTNISGAKLDIGFQFKVRAGSRISFDLELQLDSQEVIDLYTLKNNPDFPKDITLPINKTHFPLRIVVVRNQKVVAEEIFPPSCILPNKPFGFVVSSKPWAVNKVDYDTISEKARYSPISIKTTKKKPGYFHDKFKMALQCFVKQSLPDENGSTGWFNAKDSHTESAAKGKILPVKIAGMAKVS